MTGTFYHHLNAACPRAIHKLPERNQFGNLAAIRRICETAGAHPVAKTDRYIVFLTDVEDVIVTLIQRIFLAVVEHPACNK